MNQNLIVCKANKVIEASYKLSLNELRVVLACIAQINTIEELLKTDKFELSAKNFAEIFEISENRAYSELQAVAKRLFQRYVIIDNPDPEQPKIKQTQTHWISSIDYIPDDGKIVLFFAPKILPYLSLLKGGFTQYKLKHIGKMTSIYAIRLYELLMQWKATGKREIEIEWLKKQFQIEDKYSAIKDFKKYVIEPAIKDINEHSNFIVAWEQRKTGRTVTHLIFTFAEKQPEPKPEENKPKAKAKGKIINGVIQSEIEAKARPGESYENAAERIKREKQGNVKRMQNKEEKPAKPMEVWEKMGFKSVEEYAQHSFNKQMEEMNKKSK